MIMLKFQGGPLNGTSVEVDSPAELIIPKGSSENAVLNFLGGKDSLRCAYYELDDKRSNYIWRKAKS